MGLCLQMHSGKYPAHWLPVCYNPRIETPLFAEDSTQHPPPALMNTLEYHWRKALTFVLWLFVPERL